MHLVTDASDTTLGGTLYLIIDSKSVPIRFFLKRLDSTQKRYSAYDRELLSLFLFVLHLKQKIQGRKALHLLTINH